MQSMDFLRGQIADSDFRFTVQGDMRRRINPLPYLENGQWIDYQSSTVRLKSDLERAKNQQKMLEERLAEYKAEGRDTYLTEQRLESEKSRAERLEKQLQEKQ